MRDLRRRGLLAGALAGALLAAIGLLIASDHIAEEQHAYSGPRAARCLPQRLDASTLLPGTEVAVSPMPGSSDAGPKTQISFLGVPASRLSHIVVVGSSSGRHRGRLEAYSQGDGASFLPHKPFESGERVRVRGRVATGSRVRRFSFHFTVAYLDPISYAKTLPAPRPTPPTGSVRTFRSAPTLQPPAIAISRDGVRATPGDIFLAPYSGPGSKGPMIVNQQGQLIWMDSLAGELKATNLQVQSYEGQPVLTWWQGYIPEEGFGIGEEIVDDTSYETIMRIKAGNGDAADLHDFHLEPHDTAVLTVFHTIHCDLRSVGGPRDAALTDALYQELDLKTGLVRREWSSVDHVSLSESYVSPVKSSTVGPFDYFHLNTIDPRSNGTTLLSGRNTSTLYVTDTKTGQIIQQIGGKKSNVKLQPGTRTAFQHDATTLSDGEISVFDNGGSPFEQPFSQTHSRGLVVRLDGRADTDSLVREFDHSPPLQAASQGDIQEQADGGWFIGWGQEPDFSEYGPGGRLIYEAHMWAVKGNKTLETESYRTYKFRWRATPRTAPAVALQRRRGGATVYVSWNGATSVVAWKVIGGATYGRLRALASAPKLGFQTAIEVPRTRYLELEALGARGAVLGRSAILAG